MRYRVYDIKCPLFISGWPWKKHKKTWEIIFQGYFRTIFLLLKSSWKMTYCFQAELWGLPLTGVPREHARRFTFDKEGYIFRNVGSITSWDVVEKHFLNGLKEHQIKKDDKVFQKTTHKRYLQVRWAVEKRILF